MVGILGAIFKKGDSVGVRMSERFKSPKQMEKKEYCRREFWSLPRKPLQSLAEG